MPPTVHMQYKNTVTTTQKLHTIGQNQSNAFTQLSNPQWNKGCYRQAMLFHNRKTNKAACGLLALEAALVGGCFSLDLGQLIVVDSQNMKTFQFYPSSILSLDTSSKL